MSAPVVSFKAVSKKYKLGRERLAYASFRDQVSGWLSPKKSAIQSQEFWALKDVTFDIPEGSAFGIIGKNGAGKSTLLKILSQITFPTTGSIAVRGRIASLLEVGTGFHPELTGRENIYLNGSILGMSRQEIHSQFDAIVDFAEIDRFLDTPVKHYSSGMYVRLAFAVAAHIQPEVLVIDEVLAVGDASFQKKCLGRMGQVTRNGRTVIFVSHNLSTVQNLCAQSAFLSEGQVRCVGSTSEVVDSYLAQLFHEAGATNVGSRSDREGTGEVRVAKVAVLNAARQETSTAKSGDECFVQFDYRAQKPVRNLSIAWNVRDELGQPIFRASSRDTGSDEGLFPAVGQLTCNVPRLPLVPGRYRGTIELRMGDAVVDYVRDAFALIVEGGDFFGTGRINTHSPVLLDHSWDHSQLCDDHLR
jgi:lipopolysaccharide transport system ATP-binding protein